MPRLNSSESVRGELESLFYLAKTGVMNPSQADKCASILKTIAVLLREERELNFEAEINDLRSVVNELVRR